MRSGQPNSYTKEAVYPTTGDYVVSRISYTSDLTGTVIGGWRQVYLEPLPGPDSTNA